MRFFYHSDYCQKVLVMATGGRGLRRNNKNNTQNLNILSNNQDICTICENLVEDLGIACEQCNQWWHISCKGISEDHFNNFIANQPNFLYYCDNCKPNKAKESISNKAIFEQMAKMMTTMQKVLDKNEEMSKSNKEIIKRVTKLEQNNENKTVSEAQVQNIVEKKLENIVDEKVSDAIREMNEHESRKLNLIFVNVPEGEGDDPKSKDKEVLTEIMKKVLPTDDINFEQINRLGEKKQDSRPRLLKVRVKNMETKMKILKSSSKINEGSNIEDPRKKMYINIDYTRKEREMNKNLREELRNKPAHEREKYQIRNNKIVLREDTVKTSAKKD